MFEHSDAIVSIDLFPDGPKAAAAFKRKDASGVKENANSESLVLSADRDGEIILWKVSSANEDQVLQFVSASKIVEPVTRAKFLSPGRVLVTTTHGTIWSILILKDSQGNDYLEKPIAVYRNDDLSAIWDFSIIQNPLRQQANQYDVLVASDSGQVRHVLIDHIQLVESRLITVSAF